MLGLYWVGLCWGYVGAMLGLCWVGLCWGYVGAMLGGVGAMLWR